jgi:cell division protein FtsN
MDVGRICVRPERKETMRFIDLRYVTVFAAMCLACVVSLAIVSGCTTAKKSQPVRETSSEPYELESEGEIPPLPPSQVNKKVDRVETFEEMPVSDDAIDVENVEPVYEEPVPTPGAEADRKTMEGYRVQVLASGNKESADALRSQVEAKVGEAAYVELVDGVYKVRVGDCPSRGEAEALLERCRNAGFQDAWIVSCTVFMPTPKSSP